ncbi:hypothetical protein LTR66_003231 [Elasticomyces elasticus]|nr:hypothetical protein LTR66_003231 [Elasticomyces elasticus]
MAEDTRKPSEDKAFEGQQWAGAAPTYKPPENANVLPGGTNNTAGGKVQDVGFIDVVKGIKLEEFKEVHKKPCVRDALMVGIGTGFAAGGIRAIFGMSIARASNWAAGTFCIGAMGMYQYCLYQRQYEKEGMKRAVEIINRKDLDKKQREAKMERARELRRQKKEEQDRLAEEQSREEERKRNRSWWKVW